MSTYASGTETTIYVGEQLEKLTTAVRTHWKHRLPTPSGEVQVIRRSDGTTETLYLTSDHLGSMDAVTNAAGAVLSRPSFNAWGGRRGSNWQGAPSQSEWQAIADTTRRGYTGHEQLDNVMLVHMNGRVYDPAIGRFLSADPFIDGAGTVQGWNRYTYVHNQPLSRSDPSGYASVGGTGKRTQLRDGSKEISAEQELAYGRGSLAWQRQWGNAYSDFGGMPPIWSFSGPGWLQYAVLQSGGEFRGSAAGRWESQWLDRDCPGCGWTGRTPQGVEEIGFMGRPSTEVWTPVRSADSAIDSLKWLAGASSASFRLRAGWGPASTSVGAVVSGEDLLTIEIGAGGDNGDLLRGQIWGVGATATYDILLHGSRPVGPLVQRSGGCLVIGIGFCLEHAAGSGGGSGFVGSAGRGISISVYSETVRPIDVPALIDEWSCRPGYPWCQD